MAKANSTQTDPALDELTAIKHLMVFALRKSGVTQDDIAVVLGISQPQVSRTFRFPGTGGKRPRMSKEHAGGPEDE